MTAPASTTAYDRLPICETNSRNPQCSLAVRRENHTTGFFTDRALCQNRSNESASVAVVASGKYSSAWARTELYFPDATTATLADSLDRFWQRARSVKKPVVWFSRRTASEHCGFLELVSQIGRRSYAVVDAGAVIFYPTRNDGRVAPAMLSLSELSPDLVRANAIWDRAAPLSALELCPPNRDVTLSAI